MTALLTTALSSALVLTTTFATPTPPTTQVVFTRVLPEKDFVGYVVEKDMNLEDVSIKYYGSKEYWTNLLNDNPEITDPNMVKKDQMLKIRTQKPTEPAPDTHIKRSYVAPTAAMLSEDALTYLGSCEAGNNPAKNTGNGYYGAFQFSYGSWKRLNTGYERADLAPIEVQRAAVKQLLQTSSVFGQFPGCAYKMRGIGLI